LLESLNSLRLRMRSVAIAAVHVRAAKANGVPRTSIEGGVFLEPCGALSHLVAATSGVAMFGCAARGAFRGEASLSMQSAAYLAALIGSSPLSIWKDVGQRTSPVLRDAKDHCIVNGT